MNGASGSLWLRGGRLICPRQGIDTIATVEIAGGRVAAIWPAETPAPAGSRVAELEGCVVCPGWIDLHAELGEPGFEHREDLATGGRVAARAGFSALGLSAKTDPPNDARAITELLIAARARAGVRILPIAALSVGLRGTRLSEMCALAEAGAVAFGDGDRSVQDAGLLRRALEYARGAGRPVFEFPEDGRLAGDGVMHEGEVATRLGLPGVPAAAEEVAVWRAIALAELTGARLHLAPVTTIGAARALAFARREGIPVTAAASLAHLHLTDAAVAHAFDANLRVRPPLRTPLDLEAIRGALEEGTVTSLTTWHRPRAVEEKTMEFGLASPGMAGLESALGLTLRLVEEGALSLAKAISCWTAGPAEVLDGVPGAPAGRLAPGDAADVVVFDPAGATDIGQDSGAGGARNSPFLGQTLPGRVRLTLVEGAPIYSDFEFSTQSGRRDSW